MKNFNMVLALAVATAVIAQFPMRAQTATPSYTYECEGDGDGNGQGGEDLCLAVPNDENPAKSSIERADQASLDTSKPVLFGPVDEQASITKSKKSGLPSRNQSTANALQSIRAQEKFGHADTYAQQTRERLDQIQRMQEIERKKKQDADPTTLGH